MEENYLYFFVEYIRKEKEEADDICFEVPEKDELKPECIYFEELYENQIFYYRKIFKVNKSAGKRKKGNNRFEFEYVIKDKDVYTIGFESKGNTFIYEFYLTPRPKYISCCLPRSLHRKEEYYETMEFFIKALKKIGKESMIDDLYKETIELYSKKKDFAFMIRLFLNIYQKKELCIELLKIFKDINQNPKYNFKNMDRRPFLKDYISEFRTIRTEADSIIKKNNYNPIEFYGILLCYFNYYDYENFYLIINELHNKKPEILYEILLIYNEHFINPINKKFNFFNDFIRYVITNKDFLFFKKGLDYIEDLEIFLNILYTSL